MIHTAALATTPFGQDVRRETQEQQAPAEQRPVANPAERDDEERERAGQRKIHDAEAQSHEVAHQREPIHQRLNGTGEDAERQEEDEPAGQAQAPGHHRVVPVLGREHLLWRGEFGVSKETPSKRQLLTEADKSPMESISITSPASVWWALRRSWSCSAIMET